MALCMVLTLAVPAVAVEDTVDTLPAETPVTQETKGQEPPEPSETTETAPSTLPADVDEGDAGDPSSDEEEPVLPEEDNSAGVARIESETYGTLDAAVAAAADGATIELLQDCQLTSGFDKSLTFTGTGKITCSTDLPFDGANWWVYGAGKTLTFSGKDVAFEWDSSQWTKPEENKDRWLMMSLSGTIQVTDGATCTFIVDSKSGQDSYADVEGKTHYVYPNCGIYMNTGSKIEVDEGSTFKILGRNTKGISGQAIQLDNTASVNISVKEGSTFLIDGTNRGYVNSPTINVADSTFTVQNCTSNASNGGYFYADHSNINFCNNAGHGLSAGTIMVQNSSTLNAKGNGYYGVYSSSGFSVDGSSTVNVEKNSRSGDFAGLKLTSGVTDGKVEAGAEINILNNYCSGLSNNGEVVFEKGSKLTITGNNNDKGTTSNGGGIYNSGASANLTLPSDAIIYNNHAETAGDDIFNNTTSTITFGPVGTDWYLDGDPDCYHGIDGWYNDRSGMRWEAHEASEEGNHIEKFNGNTAETGDFTITDQHALKAAHGKLAAITVTPADITIYMGGDDGYEAVVGEDGESAGTVTETNSLPKPMFQITAPENVDPVDLTFTTSSEEKSWTVEKAGETADGGALYYLEAAENQDPVRVQFVRDGQAIVSDEFEPTTAGEMYLDYKIQLYTNTVNPASITVTDQNGATYELGAVGEGTLRVRAVDDTENDNNPVTPVTGAISQPVEAGKGAVTAPAGTTYTLNDTTVPVEGTGVGLLFDGIIDDETHDRTGALTDRVDDTMGDPGRYTTRHYQAQYLDLVDADNGNAWVKASGEVTVYWGYPEGTGPWMDFTLYHFQDLHRDGNNSGFEINDVASADMEEVTITTDRNGISFDVSSGGFSPFVLVWETTHYPPVDPDPDPDPTPDPDPEDPDKPGLNTEDHYAYIVGYPDGNVKPEGNITRAEVATIFFRLLTDESRDEFWSQTNPYSDVSEDDWYNNAVSTLTNAGIIDGYEDGTFKPNGNITRAEFATIAVRFFEATYEGENLFPDIDGHWAQDYINEAANAGIVDGYPDGTFGPQKLITRAEAMTMVNRTIDRHPHEDHLLADMIVWPDNPETAWYYEQVQEATNSHEYTMNTDDEQNPYEIWTELLPVRDWAQLEKEWSDAHSGQSGGDVV